MNRIYNYFVALGDLFMPRACLACGRRLGMRERHLCLSCAADVPYTRFWLAAHNPLADRFNAVLERHRGTEPMDYAYAAALIYYKGAYRSIPRALKYQGDLAAGRHYGALLGRRLAAAPHFADIDLVIPVPLHWTRLRSRGYNQAEILARALVDAFRSAPSTVIPGLTRNLPEVRTDLLVRARRTRTQTRVSVDQKAQNVASAFQVPIRFSLWSRLISRLAQFFSSFLARWPIGVGHDDNHLSSQNDNRFSGQDEDRLSGHEGNHLSSQDENRLSGHDGNHLSSQDENRLSGHEGNHLSSQDENRLLERESTRHSRLDRESPAAVLASARHILLVDDTYTTGATLYACYAALRPYTTARISIATLAAVEGTPSSGP